MGTGHKPEERRAKKIKVIFNLQVFSSVILVFVRVGEIEMVYLLCVQYYVQFFCQKGSILTLSQTVIDSTLSYG